MPQPLLKTFTASVAGAAFLASSAAAVEPRGKHTFAKDQPLLSAEDVTLYPTHQALKENSANAFVIYCPGSEIHPVREKRNEAVVILIKHSWEDMQKSFKNASAVRKYMNNDQRLTHENAGIITPQADLIKMHSFNEAQQNVRQALSDERMLNGIDINEPVFQKKMINYARDFCFSRF